MIVTGITARMIMNIPASKREITDFHSHCLPALDDGAADVTAALAMLSEAKRQGVQDVVATPHFYWGENTIEHFLEHRQRAYDQLQAQWTEGLPALRLGAEVLMREGISRLDLRPLCLEGTDILLVELPFMAPPYWLAEEMENIAVAQRLTLMLAHLDRYMSWYREKDLEMLMELPDVIVQINADSIADKRCFRALRKWLPDCDRLVLGSDMHNMGSRAPQLEAAVQVLSRNRVGRDWLEKIEITTREIFDPSILL